MFESIEVANILFLDIETVSEKPSYNELDETFQSLWKSKSRHVLRKYDEKITDEEAAQAYERAGIYSEFGKIICISVGLVTRDKKTKELRARFKSFAGDDEKQLLFDFAQLVEKFYNNPSKNYFCGHNIREFDIPYICRRMVVHQLALPRSLNIAGKKPWETKHFLDTLELWKFGDFKHYTSLKLLAALLGFPSPKDDIDGSEVGRVYWEENDLKRIARYCEKDVLATIQLFFRYQRIPLLTDEQVVFVE